MIPLLSYNFNFILLINAGPSGLHNHIFFLFSELPKNHGINFHDKNFDPKENFHKCMFCEKSYRSQHDLTGHILGLHEGDPDYKCKFCGLISIRITDLKIHLKRKHGGNSSSNPKSEKKKEEIICKICKVSFSNKSQRNFHMKKCRLEQREVKKSKIVSTTSKKSDGRSLLKRQLVFKTESGDMFKANSVFVQEAIKAVKEEVVESTTISDEVG